VAPGVVRPLVAEVDPARRRVLALGVAEAVDFGLAARLCRRAGGLGADSVGVDVDDGAGSTSATNGRTTPGATKASVLAALAGGVSMTAGQVATKAGLARPTVSTTLSKLAKTGEVQKAERGYRLTSTS